MIDVTNYIHDQNMDNEHIKYNPTSGLCYKPWLKLAYFWTYLSSFDPLFFDRSSRSGKIRYLAIHSFFFLPLFVPPADTATILQEARDTVL